MSGSWIFSMAWMRMGGQIRLGAAAAFLMTASKERPK